jgi:hypothetical protein
VSSADDENSANDLATSAAIDRAKRFRDASDKIRERSDATAKGLAALGTAGLTAVGITKFSDVFPLPPGELDVAYLVVLSFVVMTAVLAAFTFRLWNANKPLVARADLDAMLARGEIDDNEKNEMDRIYDEIAARNQSGTLRMLEDRGERFQRIADRTADANLSKQLKAKAERIRAETEVAFARAQLVVVRRRMNRALKGPSAVFLSLAFVVALVGFGLGADHIDSERTARLATYKACAEAVTAKVASAKLPEICSDAVESASPAQSTPEQMAVAAVAALTDAYSKCIDTAIDQKRPLEMCDGIRRQLTAAINAVP